MNFSAAELNGIAAALKNEHERRQCRSLLAFVRHAWPLIEADPFVDNWHLGLICGHLEALYQGDRSNLLVNVPPGTMKPCWVGSQVLERTRGRVALADIAPGDEVLTHLGRFRKVEAVHEQGILPLLEVETFRGRQVRVALEHPLLTTRGWVQAQDLLMTDVLAEVLPRESSGVDSVTPEEARLLGYLIGDGGVSHGATIFTNQDPEAIADAIHCAESIGFASLVRTKGDGCAAKVSFSTKRLEGAKKAPGSDVYDWLVKHGLRSKTSYTKRVPQAILSATPELIVEFLAAYWACDGGISDRRDLSRSGRVDQILSTVRVDCTTVSEGLARDLQHLLTRLGMSFALRRKTRALKTIRQGEAYVSWQLGAQDQDTVAKFVQLVSPKMRHEKRMRAQGVQRTKFDAALSPDAIRTIKSISAGDCRCLTVAEDHSFTVEDIAVHNSILVSVMFPAWVWTLDPSKCFLSASYAEDLATRDAVKAKTVITSAWYQRLWGERVAMRRGMDQKTRYENTSGGWRIATSVGGGGTGEHPHFILVDDPTNAKEALSDADRGTANTWFDQTLSTRGITRNAKNVVVMQRLHAKDLSGHIVARENYGTRWTHICLPMKYEPHHPYVCANDPRKVEGELLWPHFYTAQKVIDVSVPLGEYGTAGQLQQRPSPAGGGILKLSQHFRLWPCDLPLPDFEFILQSYDTAYTKDTQNDPTACTVFATFQHAGRTNVLIADYWSEHMEYPELRERVQDDWLALYGGREKDLMHPARRPDAVLIEDKGSGKSLIQDLQRANVPVTKYDPLSRDKISRAHQVAPIIELGVVWVLESKKQRGKPIAWVRPLIAQGEAFPNDEHDDGVDTLTQGLIYLNHANLLELSSVPDEEPEEQDYHRKRGNPYGSRSM